MRIVSWNVNGLRAIHKRDQLLPFIKKYKPDVICLQETKSEEEQLPEELRELDDYEVVFSSSQLRKGYSGTALYSRIPAEDMGEGMGIKKFDEEGRIVWADYGEIVVFGVYFPNGGQGPHRIKYKLEFYEVFLKHTEKLRKKGKKIIFCGDVNTAHHEIDLARPKENVENTGFLPIERAWLDKVEKKGYVDVFRSLNPKKVDMYTYWDMKTRARDRNVGWRIDYFFVSPDLMKDVKDMKILTNEMGSDHCPLMLDLK
ncbi:MAG: exodeoxyribonuclease III [bacterium]|nr:exodeoxyribonuclease III [bacterium]